MATVAPGRVICARCGANNFETQAACWKCSTPLSAAGASTVAPYRGASPDGTYVAPAPGAYPAAPTVDPSVAQWVGVIGGLVLPFLMLPIGMVFLMLDDRRKVEIGRTAVIASLVGTFLHTFFTYFLVAGAIGAAMKMLPGATGGAKSTQSASAPDYNSEAKPLEIPGIPSLSPGKN